MQSKTPAYKVALGGILAALALVIMCVGTIVPIMTYLSPIMCIVLTQTVFRVCGKRLAWAWYAAVAILSLIFAPDKEAAAVFIFLGYYPIVKPKLDAAYLGVIWKGILFNASAVIMTYLITAIMGIDLVEPEYASIRGILIAVLLLLGNVTFFLMDRLLLILPGRFRKH